MHHGVTRNNPEFEGTSDIAVHIRPRILDVPAGRTRIVNHHANALRAENDADIEESSELVFTGLLYGTAEVVICVFGGVAEGVQFPAHIVQIGPVVMHSYMIYRNGSDDSGHAQDLTKNLSVASCILRITIPFAHLNTSA
jgi:hypothetical protein